MTVKVEPRLVVFDSGSIRTLWLNEKSNWSVGRKTESNNPDVALTSKIASGDHGEIFCDGGNWYYADHNSANGTYLNEKRLDSEAVKLNSRDVLRIDYSDFDNPDTRGVMLIFMMENVGENWYSFEIPEDKLVSIGSDANRCDLVVNRRGVAPVHIHLRKYQNKYYVKAADGMASVLKNDEAITEAEFKEKDILWLGSFFVIYSNGVLIYNSMSDTMVVSNDATQMAYTRDDNYALRARIDARKVRDKNGKEITLIKDVDVDILEGKMVALLGGSGAGKTTVMNCLNGMDTSGMSGYVEFIGRDLIANFDVMKAMIGSVPQQNTFIEELTVKQMLSDAAWLRLPRGTKKSDIDFNVGRAMEWLGISHIKDKKIRFCSGGEQKRVNAAIELVADRKLLCLDEPDAGLDPHAKKELFTILRRLAHEHSKSVMVIFHDVSEIDMFDQVIIMTKDKSLNVGRLAFSGSPAEAREFFGVTNFSDIYDVLDKDYAHYIEKYQKMRGGR